MRISVAARIRERDYDDINSRVFNYNFNNNNNIIMRSDYIISCPLESNLGSTGSTMLPWWEG